MWWIPVLILAATFLLVISYTSRQRTQQKGSSTPPPWLERIGLIGERSNQPPRWQKLLWEAVQSTPSSKLLLRGQLRFDQQNPNDSLQIPDRGIRCELGRPIRSERGLHGLHLNIIDKGMIQDTVLFLTPATFTRFQRSSTEKTPQIHPCSLAAPHLALEVGDLRVELIPSDIRYAQEQPEEIDLLVSLRIEVVIWTRDRRATRD